LKIAKLGTQELTINRGYEAELVKKEKPEEVVSLCNSVFKEIIEKGIDKALIHKNPPVPYDELTGNPKNDILQKNDIHDKINALESTLKEIKEKRRAIAANSNLQSLINKELPSDREELRVDLKNIKKLICRDNNILSRIAEEKSPDNSDIELSQEQINAYRSMKDSADKRELDLMIELALLEDDEDNL